MRSSHKIPLNNFYLKMYIIFFIRVICHRVISDESVQAFGQLIATWFFTKYSREEEYESSFSRYADVEGRTSELTQGTDID